MKYKELQDMINKSNNIVFFSGAGVSTLSGLKDFKGKNGLYTNSSEEVPEYLLSNICFYQETERFYNYYKKNFNCLNIKPNIIHKYLVELEKSGKLKSIVTQNIDGLHTKAGSKNVYEIHGTIFKNHCLKCNKSYDAEFIFNSNGIPLCDCGGLIKPDVVLYGEMLPDCFNLAINDIKSCDMLLVAGTSLTVEPACSLLKLFQGKYLVIINDNKTPYDYKANLVINDDLKNVFKNLKI